MYHVILLCGNYVDIYFFEFINARIFSCQFFKYLPISSALKKSINILPLILSALNLKLSTWRPAPHAHSFLFHFMEKKGQISSSTVLNFIFGLKDTVKCTHTSFQKIRGICLMKLTIKKLCWTLYLRSRQSRAPAAGRRKVRHMANAPGRHTRTFCGNVCHKPSPDN